MATVSKKRKFEHQTRKTRSASDYFLVGFAKATIRGSKLPTLRQVMQYLLYLQEMSPPQQSIRTIISTATHRVISFWLLAGIKTISRRNAENRLEKLWKTWMNLKRSMHRERDVGNKRKLFEEDLNKLWDIGSRDAVKSIESNRLLTKEKKEEDIAFYRDQQGARLAYMSGQDKVLQKKIQERQRRLPQRNFPTLEGFVVDPTCSEESSTTDDIESASSSSEFQFSSTSSFADNEVTLKAPRNLIDNPEVVMTLDRLKVSDNAATMLLSSFVKACKGNVSDFVLSRSSTRRARLATRYQISQHILNEVSSNPPENVALHWDGKLVTDRLGSSFEALSIIASGPPKYTNGKLLGVSQLSSATGAAQAAATYDMLKMWDLEENVRALVFDTTSSNSGWKNGAAKLLEEKVGRKVFYNACRHHMYELIAGAAWCEIFGKATKSPENTLFTRLKKKWEEIDKSKPYQKLSFTTEWLNRKAIEVCNELTTLLDSDCQKKHSILRGDYRQCAELTLALLSPQLPSTVQISHHRPGAAHRARWMAHILYSQKMFMWSDQMFYDDDEIVQLQRFNQFLALFYVPAWLKTSFGSSAAANDLKFLQDMIEYKQHDKDVANVAFKKLSKHHWYLNEETVVFALFSNTISDDLKRKMADRLLLIPPPDGFRLGRPVTAVQVDSNTTLTDLIGPDSWFIFSALSVDSDWLTQPVNVWNTFQSFVKVHNFVNNVKVVNDAAERGVKLNTDYAAILSDDQQEKSKLLQAVEKHRNIMPDFSKSTLSKDVDFP